MTLHWLRRVVAAVLIMLIGQEMTAQSPPVLPRWKKGDSFFVAIDYNPDKKVQNNGLRKPSLQGDIIQAQLYLEIKIQDKIESDNAKDKPLLKVDFYIKKRVPAATGTIRYSLFIDPNRAWPGKAFERNVELAAVTDKEKSVFIISPNVSHMPLEFFPPFGTGEQKFEGSQLSLTLKWSKQANYYYTDATYKDKEGNDIIIKQKWADDEKWWQEYERYVNGRRNLVARLIPQLPEEIVKKKVPTDVKPFPFPLRLDPRLRAIVPLADSRPTLSELMTSLSAATELKITLVDTLGQHQPYLGYVQLDTNNGWKAWQIMEMLQKRDLDDGKWIKTTDGYMLTGNLKKSSLAGVAGKPPETIAAARARTSGLPRRLIILSILIVSLVGLTLAVWRRARRYVNKGA